MEASLGNNEGNLKSSAHSFQKWKLSESGEGGERYKDFQGRVTSGIRDLFKISQRGLVLVVSHGGVFEAIREDFQMPEFYLPCATPVLMYPKFNAISLERRAISPHRL